MLLGEIVAEGAVLVVHELALVRVAVSPPPKRDGFEVQRLRARLEAADAVQGELDARQVRLCAACIKGKGGEASKSVCEMQGEGGVLRRLLAKLQGGARGSFTGGSGGMLCEAPLHPPKQRTALG